MPRNVARHISLLALQLALLLACPLLWTTPAKAAESVSVPPDAGLLSLWTSEELAGSDSDRIIGAVTEPDGTTPTGSMPAKGIGPAKQRGLIRRVNIPGERKVVAITFDMCERANNVAGYNNQIVNLLRGQRAKATFFMGGKWMRSHPEKAMQLMADARFELGNHNWTHGNLALMTEAEQRTQLDLAQRQYALLRRELAARAEAKGLETAMRAVPQSMRIMRLPYGRSSELALHTLGELGYDVIQWDVEGERDEELHTPEELASAALAAIRPGSIVLLHANAVPQKTYPLLQLLLAGLRQRGYELVTVSEMLRLGAPEYSQDGYFTTPGDNLRYDTIFPGKGTLKPDPTRPYTTTPVP